MFCPKCGTQNLESAKFCKSCGREVGRRAIRSDVVKSLSMRLLFARLILTLKNNKKRTAIVILAAIVIGSLWFGYDYYYNNYSYVKYTDPATYSAPSVTPPIPVSNKDFTIDANGVLTKYTGTSGNVVIPNGVTAIGDNAITFVNSKPSSGAITSLVIPNSVTSIGSNNLELCDLRELTIPDSVTSIGDKAFNNCRNLVRLTIPNTITSIGSGIFSYTSLKEPVLLNSGTKLVYVPSMYTDYAIPDGVEDISGAFGSYNCGLTSVTVPRSVTDMGGHENSIEGIGGGNSAFSGCQKLKEIKGYTGSFAEDFAKAFEYHFEPLDSGTANSTKTTKDSKSCDSDKWFCSENNVCPDTLGDGDYIIVAKDDVIATEPWETSEEECDKPQCEKTAGGEDNLVVNKTADYSSYPAQDYCQYMGGRMPTSEELQCIYNNESDFGTFDTTRNYWSSTEKGNGYAYNVSFSDGLQYYQHQEIPNNVRCVKGYKE